MRLDDAEIRRYLLGLMPEAEAEDLEGAYLADPEVFERVRAVEDDLLDDSAAGRLGPAEREAFESRYLASPPLRQRVLAARALRLAGAGTGQWALAPVEAAGRTRWGGPLAMAAGLVAAVGAWLLWRSQSPEIGPVPAPTIAWSESPSPTATTGSMAQVPPAPSAARLAFALSPVLLRGQSGPPELRLPPGIATVVLEFEGDPAMVPARSGLLAIIETVEGTRVFRGEARRRSDRTRPSLLATAQVPAARLAPGDHLATLSAGGQTLYRYFFRVPGR